MDDIEDDARYPPNLYPPNTRRPFLKLPAPFPRPIGRNYADVDDGEDDNDGQNDFDRATDEPEEEEEEDDDEDEYADGYRRIRNDDGGSSSESRGKRRRLDKYALGFEFAPRAAAAAAAAKPPPPAPTRNSPADWSEDSTFVLLDAWGDLYLQNGRKSIRSDQWSEVAKKVAQSSKTTHSDAQCRNRLDTLKKKYRKEKARMAEDGTSNSKWVYFQKMDALMLAPSPPPPPAMRQQQQLQHPLRLPCGVDAGEYVFTGSSASLKRSNGVDEMRDSPGDTESEDDDKEGGDDSDDPPLRRENLPGSSELSFRMLADSIQKFGDIYEKIENSKRQQMAELERMRKEFHRDLEVQRMQILERAQAEIAKIRQEEGEEDEEQEERSEENDEDDDGINASN